MNDRENVEEKETPKETEKKPSARTGNGKYAVTVIAALFSGVGIGLITGVLFAPKKGKQTRKEIADKSKELVERSKNTVTDAIDKTREFTREGKSKLDKVADIFSPKKKETQKENKEK